MTEKRLQVRHVGDTLIVHSEEVIDSGTALNDHEVLSAADSRLRQPRHW